MRIGIVGAGQLGQMLGFAARDLDIECRFVDPSDNPPAASCGEVIRAPFDDPAALAALAASCDVVTYEFENVPVDALRAIEAEVPVYPPADALRHAQDRLDEKLLFGRLGIPLPGFHAIHTRDDLDTALGKLGLPMVVKTRRLGYDGKGQFVVRERADLDSAWATLGTVALIAEQWVDFDYEVSCIGVRNVGGDIAIYPLSRNVHRDGILSTSRSPVDAPSLADKADDYTRRLLTNLDYVGTLALELFVRDGELLANEFAPRVHNSGHWTIEGSDTSQFENHLRAITNAPLGSTASRGHAGMVNLIGQIPDAARALPHGVLHDYGKAPRPGRKLGHITITTRTGEERDALLDIIERNVTQYA
ncbi:MAG: 5-(carboxyamino)imidazole ribonucleotide synthase [Gammaproteobacteria bacterium]|nr:5-(carboxyamino)imidazole ribonucleotide synthase [Gammaproteobacteria bacterium]NNF50353.1 5-(carboxyamino)imidazole ribonucleotide synthase [Woeseiaceae bacterium]MBT8093981.1 5-(carboxyamino)imidazole ribonucleotide synthase [Gammaproteobacteria bacterium]MBT8105284.1 5-(carboxyamino)imidazole ribonucleotide synthase [Gammaproteobacteria bacterium]NNK25298.1 5-(carboxyamino)imidazole ribonucleotide synthase [Woeseiaceae bacterium]